MWIVSYLLKMETYLLNYHKNDVIDILNQPEESDGTSSILVKWEYFLL